MNEAQLLDNLAMAIDSPRKKGRLKAIKKAFAEYTEYLNEKKPFWERIKRLFVKVCVILLLTGFLASPMTYAGDPVVKQTTKEDLISYKTHLENQKQRILNDARLKLAVIDALIRDADAQLKSMEPKEKPKPKKDQSSERR